MGQQRTAEQGKGFSVSFAFLCGHCPIQAAPPSAGEFSYAFEVRRVAYYPDYHQSQIPLESVKAKARLEAVEYN